MRKATENLSPTVRVVAMDEAAEEEEKEKEEHYQSPSGSGP